MSINSIIDRAMNEGNGILRLAPNWVPRVFCVPGRRIKLHPDDYYSLGCNRGGIDERWFASTTWAENGPLTAPDEGLSYVAASNGEKVLLRDAVSHLKGELIGDKLWDKYGKWPMYSKFFDNKGPLPHHIHHRDSHAAAVGQMGKPEAYYFPPQVNNHGGDFPYTFFGFEPGTTKQQVRACLENFTKGDNKITALSKAYRLMPGTGWNVPPGVLHAPGSLCTYEPQKASDVFAMYQSVVNFQVIAEDMLWKNTPAEKIGDIDYLMEVIDWDLNIDPNFMDTNYMSPVPVRNEKEMADAGYCETWICYKSDAFSAKELTVFPGQTVVIRDSAAYGFIMMQGHGKINNLDIETPSLIRFGSMTQDECFVSESAAVSGVTITNLSSCDPIVMLKHFGPHNPDLIVTSCTE